MKRDNLEKFITENRSAFDKGVPSLKVWAEIDKSLSNTPKKKSINLWSFAKIAASVVLLLFAGAFGGNYLTQDTPQVDSSIADVNPNFKAMEQYYAQQVNLKLEKLKQYNHESFVEQDLKELDDFLAELKIELQHAPRGTEESIINAMIKNYQTKLSILEHVLERLQSTINQAQKTRNNETTNI